MSNDQTTYLNYAREALSAERAEAWPQAAALWPPAAECFPQHPCPRANFDRDQYLANAPACYRRARAGQPKAGNRSTRPAGQANRSAARTSSSTGGAAPRSFWALSTARRARSAA